MSTEHFWLLVGFAGQAFFTMRFGPQCRAPEAGGLCAYLPELMWHGQEVILVPIADWRVTFVPVLREAG